MIFAPVDISRELSVEPFSGERASGAYIVGLSLPDFASGWAPLTRDEVDRLIEALEEARA